MNATAFSLAMVCLNPTLEQTIKLDRYANLNRGQSQIRRWNVELDTMWQNERRVGLKLIAALARKINEAEQLGNIGFAEKERALYNQLLARYGTQPK